MPAQRALDAGELHGFGGYEPGVFTGGGWAGEMDFTRFDDALAIA
jgi:hypothetical protein